MTVIFLESPKRKIISFFDLVVLLNHSSWLYFYLPFWNWLVSLNLCFIMNDFLVIMLLGLPWNLLSNLNRISLFELNSFITSLVLIRFGQILILKPKLRFFLLLLNLFFFFNSPFLPESLNYVIKIAIKTLYLFPSRLIPWIALPMNFKPLFSVLNDVFYDFFDRVKYWLLFFGVLSVGLFRHI